MDRHVFSLGLFCLLVSTAVADVLFCEGSTGEIVCPVGTRIEIYGANYGRTQRNRCSGDNDDNVRCFNRYSLNRVFSLCNNRRRCELSATNQEFGDPCPGTYKYLQVNYGCEYDRFQPQPGRPGTFPPGQPGGFPGAFPPGQPGGFPGAFPPGQPGGFPGAFPPGQPGGFPGGFFPGRPVRAFSELPPTS